MIFVKPTKNFTGVTIEGDYEDFSNLVDSIYRMTEEEKSYKDAYEGIKLVLLTLCYEIRHASYGDREVLLKDNVVSKSVYDYHNIKNCNDNIYYSVNILFPMAIFLATSIPELYLASRKFYGKKSRRKNKPENFPSYLYSDYIRDKVNLDTLCAGIWQALGKVIGDEQLEEIIRLIENTDEDYSEYNIHYVDRCSLELINTAVEKREKKLNNIAKRLIVKNQQYYDYEDEFKHWAKHYNVNLYSLTDPKVVFPEEIIW